MGILSIQERNLTILKHITEYPDAAQAMYAVRAGVAVGANKGHSKCLIEKGYVEILIGWPYGSKD